MFETNFSGGCVINLDRNAECSLIVINYWWHNVRKLKALLYASMTVCNGSTAGMRVGGLDWCSRTTRCNEKRNQASQPAVGRKCMDALGPGICTPSFQRGYWWPLFPSQKTCQEKTAEFEFWILRFTCASTPDTSDAASSLRHRDGENRCESACRAIPGAGGPNRS